MEERIKRMMSHCITGLERVKKIITVYFWYNTYVNLLYVQNAGFETLQQVVYIFTTVIKTVNVINMITSVLMFMLPSTYLPECCSE
jgi:hypothetical protein